MTALISILVIAIIVIIFLIMKIRKYQQEINFISCNVRELVNNDTTEYILIQTDNWYLKELVRSINILIENKRKLNSSHYKIQAMMKNMATNIAHDLRTPLTIMMGYLEKIEVQKNLTVDERLIIIHKIHLKCKSLSNMIDSFFDIAKLESGDYRLTMDKIELNELCKQAILSYYDLLIKKQIKIEIVIPKENYYILGDSKAIKRILDNLISNSIRYGRNERDNILRIELVGDPKIVFMRVCDKGRGMSKQYMTTVFDRLVTLEESRNKSFQGTGLGLTISRQLALSMDAKLSVKSHPYKKTCFTVEFKRLNY